MLRNGHLVLADTFLKNVSNHGQTLTEKPGKKENTCMFLLDTFYFKMKLII